MIPILCLVTIIWVVCTGLVFSKMSELENHMQEIRSDLARINHKLIRLCAREQDSESQL